jgi:hypothetical protein
MQESTRDIQTPELEATELLDSHGALRSVSITSVRLLRVTTELAYISPVTLRSPVVVISHLMLGLVITVPSAASGGPSKPPATALRTKAVVVVRQSLEPLAAWAISRSAATFSTGGSLE